MVQQSAGRPGLGVSGKFLVHQLWRWQGSLYRLCLLEFIFFIVPFAIFSAVYRNAFNDDQKRVFDQLVRYCHGYISALPISFILGFYVNIVANRWWQQCLSLPSPDSLMMSISMYIPGNDKESRMLRKTLCLNANLMAVLLFRDISSSVRSQLETLEDVVRAGLMTRAEMESFKSVKTDIDKFWVPGFWFIHRLQEAKANGKIPDPHGAHLIMKELLEFRSHCGNLWSHDWVKMPLVYTQVVTLATYSYWVASILGRQFTDVDQGKVFPTDVYFPIWTILEILFYTGILKVAEHMVSPYGDDDEDFDLIYLINRHKEAIHVGTEILTNEECPPIPEDILSNVPSQFHSRSINTKKSYGSRDETDRLMAA